MNSKDLERIIDGVLVHAGFRRVKESWYKTNEDTITLVNFQKSQWGGQYYLNLGVYLRDLGSATTPLEHQCHIRTRLDSVVPKSDAPIQRALDLEDPGVSDNQRTAALQRALTDIAIPFLGERSAVPRLRELLATQQLEAVFLSRIARDWLSTRSE